MVGIIKNCHLIMNKIILLFIILLMLGLIAVNKEHFGSKIFDPAQWFFQGQGAAYDDVKHTKGIDYDYNYS